MQPTVELSAEQVARFHREGFLRLPQLSSPKELERIRIVYDDLFAGTEGSENGMRFDLASRQTERLLLPQILDPGVFRPELRETLAWANAGRVMDQLLGQVPDWRGDHAILKPAGYGAPTPWHQDEAYWDPSLEHRSLSIWLPLQDVGEDEGCLWFIPGSQNLDILRHRPIGGDAGVHGLELDEPVPGAPVAVPLQAGEATVHGGRTLHYAGPNVSDAPRRAYIMMGGMNGLPMAAPRTFEWQELQKKAGAPASLS